MKRPKPPRTRGDRDKAREQPRERPSTRPTDKSREREASPFATKSFVIDGMAALAEYVRFRPEAVTEVRCLPKLQGEVKALLQRHGVEVPIQVREAAAGSEAAPVAARVMLKAMDVETFVRRLADRKRDVVLALDHITDPRNLGAIARSAAFFGVKEVIAPERRQVLLTQAAVATAQGGFALTELVCVVNLARTIEKLKDLGYWVIGTTMEGEPYGDVASAYEKVVVVLGSEESGLSKGVRDLCDRVVKIPAHNGGRSLGLESLNVSVAAGIVLCEFAKARDREKG